LLLSACTGFRVKEHHDVELPACHIIYDAGSSATRLFVYQQTGGGWRAFRGPEAGALADPVLGNRGKSMRDASTVVDDIVMALEQIRSDGPPGSDGAPAWPAFDWQKRCRVETVSVFATAGMRIAEQQNPQASRMLWQLLDQELSDAVPVDVTARTLTGYEEGLFAWLAQREQEVDSQFGLAEMGGASMQVVFPCGQCGASRTVRVKGRDLAIFSQSLLGWGQDEVWKNSAHLGACQVGSGTGNPGWTSTDCSTGIEGFSTAIAEVVQNINSTAELSWFVSGAFSYMRGTDIDDYCRQGIESSFEPVSACFRAIYLQNVLDTLGLTGAADKSAVSWTLGAVVCTDTRCLEVD
jgi:hypothetical protein